MPAYAIAHLQEAAPHPEIAEYIERIPPPSSRTADAFSCTPRSTR